MPIYEYCCEECGTQFETIVTSAAGAGDVRCDRCDREKVQKKLSGFASPSSASPGGSRSGCAPGSRFS